MGTWELREWGTEGRRAAAQQGGQASPTELSTPGQDFRAKGQTWDDIGAKGPKERPSGMTSLRIQTEYRGHRAERVQSPGGTREGAEK